jgi:hypothetical protein
VNSTCHLRGHASFLDIIPRIVVLITVSGLIGYVWLSRSLADHSRHSAMRCSLVHLAFLADN